MRDRNKMARHIWKENAQEVIEFLDKREMKKTFQTEKSFLNAIGRLLIKEINHSPIAKEEPYEYFWLCRKKSVEGNSIESAKPRNILYIIRLLNGKVSIPDAHDDAHDDDPYDDPYADIYDEFSLDELEYLCEKLDRLCDAFERVYG